MKNWPRLTETLTGSTRPGACRSCGECVFGANLELWREHDENDQPEPRFLWLCSRCSKELIEPHVRLYGTVNENSPAPGAMLLCVDCVHGKTGLCANPAAKMNGGSGLNITVAPYSVAFVDGVRNGKRCGWRETIFEGPPRACSGRTL